MAERVSSRKVSRRATLGWLAAAPAVALLGNAAAAEKGEKAAEEAPKAPPKPSDYARFMPGARLSGAASTPCPRARQIPRS